MQVKQEPLANSCTTPLESSNWTCRGLECFTIELHI